MLINKRARGDYYDPDTWEVFLCAGDLITQAVVDHLDTLGLVETEAELQGILFEGEVSERWVGWGRSKNTIARVVLRPGNGDIRIDGLTIWDRFSKTPSDARSFLNRLLALDEVKPVLAQIEVVAFVKGSSPEHKRQVKAIAHALANALNSYDQSLGIHLRKYGFGGAKVKDKND